MNVYENDLIHAVLGDAQNQDQGHLEEGSHLQGDVHDQSHQNVPNIAVGIDQDQGHQSLTGNEDHNSA